MRRIPSKRPSIDELLEHTWLANRREMTNKREAAVFNANRMVSFKDEWRFRYCKLFDVHHHCCHGRSVGPSVCQVVRNKRFWTKMSQNHFGVMKTRQIQPFPPLIVKMARTVRRKINFCHLLLCLFQTRGAKPRSSGRGRDCLRRAKCQIGFSLFPGKLIQMGGKRGNKKNDDELFQ